MEKKKVIALAVIAFLAVGLIIFAVLYDAVFDKCILEINGVRYTKDDFIEYLTLARTEDPTITTDDGFTQYEQIKVLYQEAEKRGLTLTEDEINNINAAYESADKEALEAAGITSEKYANLYKQTILARNVQTKLVEDYPMPDEVYEQYKQAYADYLKTYEYRVLQVSAQTVETEETNEAGETVSKGLTDEQIAELEAQYKDEAKAKAEEALAKIQAGEDFEEVAKDYGSYRFISTLNGYNIVNGSLESMPLLYLSNSMLDENLYNAIVNQS